MHLCWGNYEGPHHHDVALRDIIDIVFEARPAAISFEGANPRHEHEWKVFEDVKLPDGKVLIPGVLDSTTNYIEHPELVAAAHRPLRAGSSAARTSSPARDCGFATFASSRRSTPDHLGQARARWPRAPSWPRRSSTDGALHFLKRCSASPTRSTRRPRASSRASWRSRASRSCSRAPTGCSCRSPTASGRASSQGRG